MVKPADTEVTMRHGLLVMLALLAMPAVADAQVTAAPGVVVKTDVVYGRVQGSALLADLAYPEKGERLPAIMYVHGGRWRGGTRANQNFANLSKWAQQGFFTASIDYRLVGGSPAPAAYEDTQTAIRWLHANAAALRIDPDRIYLIGESSGGHLVTLAASLGDGPYARVGGWEKARNDVRGVISVAGPYDLPTLSWGNLWTPVTGDVDAARRQASPEHHVSASMKPILVIHSDDDRSVPIEQAVRFVKVLEGAGVRHRFVHYKDRGHMGLTDEVLKEAHAFIAEVEKGR
jgi:acetyl esterase/lipase